MPMQRDDFRALIDHCTVLPGGRLEQPENYLYSQDDRNHGWRQQVKGPGFRPC